ncbi:MAG: nuclear transport factor 2 family protein [Solirubrobacteraceae bacterium]
MAASPRQLTAAFCALALAVGLAACGETASTGNFKGESHNVAQTVSDFQSDATAGNQTKLCQNDLASTLTTRLQSAGGCQAVLKEQLHEIDALNMTIESIAVNGASATAHVKSTYSGKSRITTLTLVKEGSRWKVSGAKS